MSSPTLLWRALLCAAFALALCGCRDECDCPELPACPAAPPSPPPKNPPAPRPAQAPTPAAPTIARAAKAAEAVVPPKTEEQERAEQLKRDIEELRKQLRNIPRQPARPVPTPGAPRPPMTFEQIKARLDELDRGDMELLHGSTDELIKRRIALPDRAIDNFSSWPPDYEIFRLLLFRLNQSMSRDEVHRLLGQPGAVIGGADVYSPRRWSSGVIDFALRHFSLEELPEPQTHTHGMWLSLIFVVRYQDGHFSRVSPSPEQCYCPICQISY